MEARSDGMDGSAMNEPYILDCDTVEYVCTYKNKVEIFTKKVEKKYVVDAPWFSEFSIKNKDLLMFIIIPLYVLYSWWIHSSLYFLIHSYIRTVFTIRGMQTDQTSSISCWIHYFQLITLHFNVSTEPIAITDMQDSDVV